MAEATYRAGIIGLGFIGGADQVSGDRIGQRVADLDGTHLEAFTKSPRVNLVAGSSRDEGRRARFAARTGARTYSDWRELLEAETLDIVSVATYAPTHAEIAIACTESGVRAVYGEKPMATTAADAERMLSAATTSGTLLAVNHNRRFNPNYRRLRDLVAGGGLGTLTSLNLQWGGGRLGNVGTHLIDAAVMLTGQRVAAVSAGLDKTGRPDCRGAQFRDPGGWGILTFESGVVATVDAADLGAVPACLALNGTKGRALTGAAAVTLEYWDGRSEHWPPPEDGLTSMDRAIAEIVAALDGQQPFPYDATEAAHTLEVILACHVSDGRDSRRIGLPLTGSDRSRAVRSG